MTLYDLSAIDPNHRYRAFQSIIRVEEYKQQYRLMNRLPLRIEAMSRDELKNFFFELVEENRQLRELLEG